MAACSLQSYVISDLCLGKPALKSLPTSSTVSEALLALKNSDDNFISIWNCDHWNSLSSPITHKNTNGDFECQCVGKICMLDIISHLRRNEQALTSPNSLSSLLDSPVSEILPQTSGLVKHIQPSSSLVEAIDLILEGAQNLVVQIQGTASAHFRRKQQAKAAAAGSGGGGGGGPTSFHGSKEYCWLTAEDVIRFILGRISLFSPLPALSIDSLQVIETDVIAIHYHAPATAAIDAISRSVTDRASVALIDDYGSLVADISPSTFAASDETVAAAVMTLSCADLISYIDWYGQAEDLVRVIKLRLREKNLDGLLSILDEEYSIGSSPDNDSSSDDETSSLSSSTCSISPKVVRSRKMNRSTSLSAKRSETVVCHPRSSLMAVMIQAIAHRVNSVWVVEDDCSLAGIVTLSDMLEVFRDHFEWRNC